MTDQDHQDQLEAQVREMLGRDDIIRLITNTPQRPKGPVNIHILAPQLLAAWAALTDPERRLWMQTSAMGDYPRRTRRQLAAELHIFTEDLKQARALVLKKLQDGLWPPPFPGLVPRAVNMLRAAGITRPDQLAGNGINDFLDFATGFNISLFTQLEAWMARHGDPSLRDRLTLPNRRRLHIQ